MRILVRSPNWIGDQVLAYPFFHYLREAFPKARIAAACMPWVRSIQFMNLVDEVYELPRPEEDGWVAKARALSRAGRELRAQGPWDLAVTLPNSFSSAAVLRWAGARERVGYAAEGRAWLLSRPVPWNASLVAHRAEAYLSLLPPGSRRRSVDFWGVPPEDDLDPGTPGVITEFDAGLAWPLADAPEPPHDSYWVLAPGSMAESRRWPVEAFAAFARRVVQETGWPGVVIGGAAEAALAARLTEDRSLKLRDWTGRGSAATYWKIFRSARFTVANDSGLAHVASLCGSAVFIPWGGGDPKRTRPIGPGRARLLLNPVECWPCERNACVLPGARKVECLRGIEPEAVWEEVRIGIQH